MKIEIREAIEQDIIETSKLYIEALNGDYKNFIPKEIIDTYSVEKETLECKRLLENREQFHLMYVALVEGVIAGYITAASNTAEPYIYDSEVINIIVKRDFQRKGIGVRLLKTTLETLKGNGFSSVMIYNFCESKANSFYRKLGGRILKLEAENKGSKGIEVDLFGWEIDSLLDKLHTLIKKY